MDQQFSPMGIYFGWSFGVIYSCLYSSIGVCICPVFVIANWAHSLCYNGICVLFHIGFNNFSSLKKYYIPYILYFHDFTFPFIYFTKSWKGEMILMGVWAFGFVGTIFCHVIWVSLITPSTCQTFSAAQPVVSIPLKFKALQGCGDVLFYPFEAISNFCFLE